MAKESRKDSREDVRLLRSELPQETREVTKEMKIVFDKKGIDEKTTYALMDAFHNYTERFGLRKATVAWQETLDNLRSVTENVGKMNEAELEQFKQALSNRIARMRQKFEESEKSSKVYTVFRRRLFHVLFSELGTPEYKKDHMTEAIKKALSDNLTAKKKK